MGQQDDQQALDELQNEANQVGVKIPALEDDQSDKGDEPESESDQDTDENKEPERDDNSDSEDDQNDDSKKGDQEDDEDPDKSKQTQKVPIKQRVEQRSQKRAARLANVEKEVGSIKGLLTQVLDKLNGTPADQKQAEDKIKKFAEAHNLDEDQIRGLSEIILEEAKAKLQPEQTQDQETDDEDDDDVELDQPAAADEPALVTDQKAEAAHFDGEFGQFLPQLKTDFPNATERQLADAKKLLFTISHQKQYADKELEYVFWKERSKFKDVLFAPKRKTAESGSLGDADDQGAPELPTNPKSKSEIDRLEKALNSAVDAEDEKVTIHRDGEEITF